MMPTATTPQFDLLVTGPVLAPAIGAVLVLTVDALWPRRRTPALLVGVLALLVGLGSAVILRLRAATDGEQASVCLPDDPSLAVRPPDGATVSDCLVRVGETGALLQALAAAAGLAVLVLLLARSGGVEAPTRSVGPGPRDGLAPRAASTAGPGVEIALLLASVTGAATVSAAHDLGSWLIGLELATLPVVALAVLRGGARDSGAMQLITTSITSFALAVVGAGLWVTATGSLRLGAAAAGEAGQDDGTRAVLTLAVVMLLAGLAFKLSLVPFHAWTPATYPRAGVSVALLLATVSVVAAVGALIALMDGAAGVLPQLAPVLAVLAVVSMIVGAVIALRATDPLRLVAWSAVTQGGWIIAPLAAGDIAAAVGYLAVYVVAIAAVLSVVAALAPEGGRVLDDDRGLLRRRPVHAAVLTLGLLTLAGLPPGVAGLLAKILVLRPLAAEGLWWIALPAVAAAALGFAVYLRWVALILLPADDGRDPEQVSRAATGVALAAGLLLLTATVLPVILLGAGTN